MKKIGSCLAVAAMLSLVQPVSAQSLESLLPTEGVGCFVRDYDAAHLARNPQQTVERMRLVVTNSIRQRKGDYPAGWLYVVVAYSVKGRSGETWESAFCENAPDGPESPLTCAARCYGMTYEFKLAIEGKDGFRLDLSGPQLPFCHADAALTHRDNRVFVLRRAPAESCALLRR